MDQKKEVRKLNLEELEARIAPTGGGSGSASGTGTNSSSGSSAGGAAPVVGQGGSM